MFAYAEIEVDSAIASVLNSLVPLNTLLLGYLFFKIKSNNFQIIGVIIGFIGAIFLILEGYVINPNNNYNYSVLIILATLMYAANVNIIKRFLNDIPPLTITVANFTTIIIPSLVVLIFSGGFDNVTISNSSFFPSLGFVVVLSIFGTALAKILFNTLIQISTPVFASSVTYLMPLVALGWGILDSEVFSINQGLASILILSGIYLSNKRNKKDR